MKTTIVAFIVLSAIMNSTLLLSQCPDINLQDVKSNEVKTAEFGNDELGLDDTYDSKYEIDIRMYISGLLCQYSTLYRFYCSEGVFIGQKIRYDLEVKTYDNYGLDYNIKITKKKDTILQKLDAKYFIDTLELYRFFSMTGFTDSILTDTTYNDSLNKMILTEHILSDIDYFNFKYKIGEVYRDFSFNSPFSIQKIPIITDTETQNICKVIEYMLSFFEENDKNKK